MNITDRLHLAPPARILIVDDHPNAASTLAQSLEQCGSPVEVLTALSAPSALELIVQYMVDVLITDFALPGMNGLELVETLHTSCDGVARHAPAYIILITAYHSPKLVASALRLGVDHYLIKPVHPRKIQAIVGEFLEWLKPRPADHAWQPHWSDRRGIESRGERIAAIVYELRNPLSSILVYADLIEKTSQRIPSQGEYLNRVREMTAHISDLLCQLLELAQPHRRYAAHAEVCDLRALLADLPPELRQRAALNHQTLVLNVPKELSLVLGEAQGWRLAISSLIDHAIRCTPVGGEITITMAPCAVAVRLNIRDTGFGIQPNELALLFEEAQPVSEQDGLGLAVVKSIVRRQGGSLSVESMPGQGSCFIITMPRASITPTPFLPPQLSNRSI